MVRCVMWMWGVGSVRVWMLCFFFFQAEDGIRDLVRSRGLGDVYKRQQIGAYRKRYGYYPEVVCADKIYRTRENLQYCQKYGIRLSGPKLGRPFKESQKNKAILRERRSIEREDERTRIAVEGKFGEGKRRYSLDRIGAKLRVTSESAIMMVFLVMNLMVLYRRKARAFFVLLIDTLFEMVRRALRKRIW